MESSGTLLIYLLTPCFTLKTLKNFYMKALQNLLLNDFELLLAPFASKSIIFVMNIDGLVHVNCNRSIWTQKLPKEALIHKLQGFVRIFCENLKILA